MFICFVHPIYRLSSWEGVSPQSRRIYYAFVLSGLKEKGKGMGLDIVNGASWKVSRFPIREDSGAPNWEGVSFNAGGGPRLASEGDGNIRCVRKKSVWSEETKDLEAVVRGDLKMLGLRLRLFQDMSEFSGPDVCAHLAVFSCQRAGEVSSPIYFQDSKLGGVKPSLS
jgi:hypothetical protein